MFTLRVFTRKPTGKNYPAALGNSVHFAVCSDGKEDGVYDRLAVFYINLLI